MRVADEIRARLAGLKPKRLELIDESGRHAGHAGARPEGESHFRLRLGAAALARPRGPRRLVHRAFASDRIAQDFDHARRAAYQRTAGRPLDAEDPPPRAS